MARGVPATTASWMVAQVGNIGGDDGPPPPQSRRPIRAASLPGLSGTTRTGGPGRSSRLTTRKTSRAPACFSPSDTGRQEPGSLGDHAGRPIAGQASRQRPDIEPGQVELRDGQDVRIDEGGQRPGPGIISRRLRGLSQDASGERDKDLQHGSSSSWERIGDRTPHSIDQPAGFSS